ncbi:MULTISPECIES: pentapeptide repeat-containing protein [Planktothricoides]|uniref:Pentapeptide repeat-containing protein n=2 Tax=Planktothricoides raciborskii TaxID=132608 RepID=A0AAU8JLT0_9CYAN|nr:MULTISPECIES: pentapeptide repeat-containing protein [Planktothricoides]MBD2546079.1 pentapeptide repeat-containing protein [Planktothricoides raciborskii FACHB-1370]MBD2584337.1 pentapeptide repeat-containing protein [Planktothricoides raciborskii FACHB-1261]
MNGNLDNSVFTYSETIAPGENVSLEDDLINDSAKETSNANRPDWRIHWLKRVDRLLQSLRRLGASTLETTVFVTVTAVPLAAGWYANEYHTGKLVPLNPVLAIAVEEIAVKLALPGCPQGSIRDAGIRSHFRNASNPQVDHQGLIWCGRPVAPVTNLFWSVAIAAPGILAISHIYKLGKTGQTFAKRWCNIQVVTDSGNPPGIWRAFWREGIGKFWLPVAIAYSLWWGTGAVPDLRILAGLTGMLWLFDNISAGFDPQQRTLHDKWARTWVNALPTSQSVPWQLSTAVSESQILTSEVEEGVMEHQEEKETIIRSIIRWLREHQEIGLVCGIAITMIVILGALVGTQAYVQNQASLRSRQEQENQKFLKLVDQFAPNERQGAILALGSLNHPEVGIKMLTDLLALEDDPAQISSIEQALVSAGANALPYLHKLNQALRTDLDSLRYGGNQAEQQIAALKQRSTQRAIAKILRVYSSELPGINLNRIDLGQVTSSLAKFTLVLEKVNLSGIQLRGAILTGANFHGSQFSSAGPDRRFGTFDDVKADLSGALMADANLSEAFLPSAIMEKIDLSRANLNQANLSNSNLIDANLSSAQLIGADLTYANLSQAKLTGANLVSADFSQAQLGGGRLGQAIAKAANFQGANFRNPTLGAADLQGADFREANLSNANLQNANLSATNLSGANLANAQLQNANFQNADLTGVDLRGANLAGANLQGAIFATAPAEKSPKTQKTDSFIIKSPPALGMGLLQGVNFNQVQNLDLKQISYLCTQGVVHEQCDMTPQP